VACFPSVRLLRLLIRFEYANVCNCLYADKSDFCEWTDWVSLLEKSNENVRTECEISWFFFFSPSSSIQCIAKCLHLIWSCNDAWCVTLQFRILIVQYLWSFLFCDHISKGHAWRESASPNVITVPEILMYQFLIKVFYCQSAPAEWNTHLQIFFLSVNLLGAVAISANAFLPQFWSVAVVFKWLQIQKQTRDYFIWSLIT